MIKQKILSKQCFIASVSMTTTLTLSAPVFANQQCDVIFAVNDKKRNDSQIVFMNGDGTGVQPLGFEYAGFDLEAMDIDANNVLYVASGDDGNQPGYLYQVNKATADLTGVGQLCVSEADGITFNLADNTLWGWGQSQGIFHILRDTDGALDLSSCQIVFSNTSEIEDLTWNNEGTVLYGIGNAFEGDHDVSQDSDKPRSVIAFMPTTGTVEAVCGEAIASIPSEIEGLEMQPDGSLILTYHNINEISVQTTIDPVTCDIGNSVRNPTRFNDIEALACCVDQGSDVPWTYQQDYVGDATGFSKLEIYGMATKIEAGTMTIAINANMQGQDVLYYKKKRIDFGDMIFDFSGTKYAVKFAVDSDSGVTEPGLYADVTLKDVTKYNHGWHTFKSYNKYLKGRGNLGALTLKNDYFSWKAKRSVPMSIKTGTKVGDITLLSEAELLAKGLDFAGNLQNAQGVYTFGFSFEMTSDMQGDFLTYFFTECINDGMAMMVSREPSC